MKSASLELLACPKCHGRLVFSGTECEPLLSGTLICPACSINYAIVEGIPHFIQTNELEGLNRRFANMYNLFSWFYSAFSRIAFAYIGMDEEKGRREITDRLEPNSGRVLEISIGPGVNLPYLMPRSDVGEIFGLDISLGQLQRCQSFIRRKSWSVDLILGNGEQLPFRNDSFEGVFHVGGINFFNNKKAAIEEMIRVAKPGTRILIADETEKGAQGYEKYIPGFKGSFGAKRDAIHPPVDLVPREMLETRVFDVWKGWMYCIEFIKP
jgi:ubiquinone/menaquinone biosynthesis C-methylase UbiE